MKKIKIINVDGFKYSYLEHAPYLKSLTEKYQHGKVIIPFGFWGAMDVFFNGKSDILSFFHYSDNSSWKSVKYFKFFGNFLCNCYINFFRFLKRQKLFYAYHIPLKKLHKFDTVIKKYFSQGYNVDFVYIGDLDKIGHKYGTSAPETIECIKRIDKVLSEENFDIIMSDNGMMDVTDVVEVPETEKCFIDSTLARYWGEKPKNMLMDKGKWITWENKLYGDYIFSANPGVLFLPNYWQGKKPAKGMHGYDSNVEDMKTLYVLNREGKRKDVDMKELHHIFLSFIK